MSDTRASGSGGSSVSPMTGKRAARPSTEKARGPFGLTERTTTWILALVLVVWSGALRLYKLGHVKTLIFDEVYYVRDAYTLLREGNERAWAKDVSKAAFERGDIDSYLPDPQYVVHPPVGKWVIALGEWALGADNPWGWRISVALVGTLGVLMLFLTVRRLLGNTALAFLAAYLLSIDGVHLTHSRTSLLDLILGFFCLLAFYFLLRDRDQFRDALGRIEGAVGGFGHVTGVRWWRIAAGISLGLACGVKWSGLYFVAVFGIMTVLWDWAARRRFGDPRWKLRGFALDAIPAFFAIVGSALATYALSWTGWFASKDGYFRNWAAENGHASNPVTEALASLWHYHQEAYSFHVGLDSTHTYAAKPWLWLLQLRPTSFYYESYTYGEAGCEVEKCSAAITNLGNPFIWWFGALALLVTLVVAIVRRSGTAGAILSGIIAGYLPWFLYLDRTIFQFYSVVFEPWLIMAIVFVFALMLGTRTASRTRRRIAIFAIASLVVTMTLASAFWWPLWTAQVIPYDLWRAHMWFDSWI